MEHTSDNKTFQNGGMPKAMGFFAEPILLPHMVTDAFEGFSREGGCPVHWFSFCGYLNNKLHDQRKRFKGNRRQRKQSHQSGEPRFGDEFAEIPSQAMGYNDDTMFRR